MSSSSYSLRNNLKTSNPSPNYRFTVPASSLTSSKVQKSANINHSYSLINPQAAMHAHMARMHSLLEEYQRENGYYHKDGNKGSNREVLGLLQRKQMIDKQYQQNSSKYVQKDKKKNTIINSDSNNAFKTKQTVDNRTLLSKLQMNKQRQALRQKYGYGRNSVDQTKRDPQTADRYSSRDNITEYKERRQAISRRKYQYLSAQDNDDQNRNQTSPTPQRNKKYYSYTDDKQNVDIKPFTISTQNNDNKSNRQTQAMNNKNNHRLSPERSRKQIKSPLQSINENEQLSNINNNYKNNNVRESIRSQLIFSNNTTPVQIIKRQPYIVESPELSKQSNNSPSVVKDSMNDPSNNNNNDNRYHFDVNARNSRNSRRSNGSKSGIQVTLSNKGSPQKSIQKSNIESKHEVCINQSKIAESIIKIYDQQQKPKQPQHNIIQVKQVKQSIKSEPVNVPAQSNNNIVIKKQKAQQISPPLITFSQQQLHNFIPPKQQQKPSNFEPRKNTTAQIIKPQPVHIDQPVAYQPSVRYVSSIGVNTQQDRHLYRSRSYSQHRIQPSEKIMPDASRSISRNGSSKHIGGKSKDKKKYINVVSSQMLTSKSFLFNKGN